MVIKPKAEGTDNGSVRITGHDHAELRILMQIFVELILASGSEFTVRFLGQLVPLFSDRIRPFFSKSLFKCLLDIGDLIKSQVLKWF